MRHTVNISSNPSDIVLDAFRGCGAALVAAQNLGRQWIGIDISPTCTFGTAPAKPASPARAIGHA